MSSGLRWKRVLLKLSGEAFAGGLDAGLDLPTINFIADEIASVHALGTEVGAVVGGGNYIRGAELAEAGMDRVTADYMGMLGTVINALALREALEKRGVDTRVQTAIAMNSIAEPYIRLRAIRHLEKGRVVIFAGGTGNPYFSTDSAAALRATEIKCDVLLMAKNKTDGVYDRDPNRFADAVRFDRLTHEEVFVRQLRVMDRTALTLSMENELPIIVFDIAQAGNMARAVTGQEVGTVIGVIGGPENETARGESR
jgi:uridylate kinase